MSLAWRRLASLGVAWRGASERGQASQLVELRFMPSLPFMLPARQGGPGAAWRSTAQTNVNVLVIALRCNDDKRGE